MGKRIRKILVMVMGFVLAVFLTPFVIQYPGFSESTLVARQAISAVGIGLGVMVVFFFVELSKKI